jgi:hypothetical protein
MPGLFLKRVPLRDAFRDPECSSSSFFSDADVQNRKSAGGHFGVKSALCRIDRPRIRVDRYYSETLVKVECGVVAVMHADIVN